MTDRLHCHPHPHAPLLPSNRRSKFRFCAAHGLLHSTFKDRRPPEKDITLGKRIHQGKETSFSPFCVPIIVQIAGTIASVRRNRVQGDELDNEVNGRGHSSRETRYNEPSFIAETSFVRAPLNSRVSSGAVPQKSKGKGKQESLDHVSVEIQEAMILEDLLYVLMVGGSSFRAVAVSSYIGNRRDIRDFSSRLLAGGRRSSTRRPFHRCTLTGLVLARPRGTNTSSRHVLHCHLFVY